MALLMLNQIAASAVASEPLTVYTVNYPLQYFARRVAGPHAQVVFPAPADVDPAFWQPDIDTIIEYQQADLVLLNGAGYARWVNKVSLPVSRLVNTSAAFQDNYIEIETTTTHSHGPAGDHSHAGTAFTTWLDFTQALEQARVIRDALVKLRPDLADSFERGFNLLEHELLALDAELKSVVNNHPLPVLASHPVYQYLARGYGLNLRSVTWEPDELPSTEQWIAFRSLLAGHPARWMLWEDNPDAEIVMRLQSLDVDVVVFNPCANKPEAGDFMSVMHENLQRLKDVSVRMTTH
jgi:zinc transport system substrate-binding protein